MRILLVNKFIFPKGGAETYTFDVGKMLEEHGHEVQYFGLENEKNIVGNRVDSYVTNMDFSQGIRANLNAPFRIIYSREARKKIRAVLDDFQPDVVHLNNIQYHLTPSIILEINKWRKETKKECRIVYTTHDYQLVCPSHGMFDVNMKPCERCLDGHYIHCLQTKCLKNSRAKSLLGTLDGYMWKYSKAYSYVDAYICCSFFLKSKLDTQKRFRDKTIGLHNFKKEMPHLDNIQKKGYVLEFGHLSRDKGTDTLLEVAKKMPNTEFVFIGYGPSVDKMKDIPNVKYGKIISALKKCRRLLAGWAGKKFGIDLYRYGTAQYKKMTGQTVANYDSMWQKIIEAKPMRSNSIPGAFVKWDNTPRHGERGQINVGTPEKFEYYLSKQIKHAREDYHEDMIFMYAWNEWAEGGYLEPDEDDKYGYLEAIKRALEENNEFPEFQNKKNENDEVK